MAKFEAIQDCEDAINAEEQRQARRRLLQHYRDQENQRKREIDKHNGSGEPKS